MDGVCLLMLLIVDSKNGELKRYLFSLLGTLGRVEIEVDSYGDECGEWFCEDVDRVSDPISPRRQLVPRKHVCKTCLFLDEGACPVGYVRVGCYFEEKGPVSQMVFILPQLFGGLDSIPYRGTPRGGAPGPGSKTLALLRVWLGRTVPSEFRAQFSC